jgi:hypothetical protein
VARRAEIRRGRDTEGDVHTLKAITFRYDGKEDRILAVINPGRPENWSCWLTRRLTLALLDRSPGLIESTSPLARRAALDARAEIAAFERDAAIASTAPAMTNTPSEVLTTGATSAELVKQVKISQQSDNFRIELQGYNGGTAVGLVSRSELQRVLEMLRSEIIKGEWQTAPTEPPVVAASPSTGAKPPSRH